MEKEFVTYDQALALKELGFNEPCFAYYSINNIENKLFYDIDSDDGELTALNQNQFYHNNLSEVGRISSPLKQQVFRWFREKHKIQSLIQEYMLNTYMYTIVDGINDDISVVGYETYEEAENACIGKLIEIVKNK
jgi:hypothetical protein